MNSRSAWITQTDSYTATLSQKKNHNHYYHSTVFKKIIVKEVKAKELLDNGGD